MFSCRFAKLESTNFSDIMDWGVDLMAWIQNRLFVDFGIACPSLLSIYGVNNNLLTDIKLSVTYQEDYEEIGEVVNYLKEKLDSNNTAYMITHTNK